MPVSRQLAVFSAASLAALVAFAADPPGPAALPHPESPSQWACSARTLESATDCLLDSETPTGGDAASVGRENVKQAQALAARVCKPAAKVGGEAKPDDELYATCQREFSAAAENACSLDGEAALLDAQGRFALQARSCYAALDGVLRRTRLQAALGVRCCRCLEKSCGVSRAVCATDIAEGDLSDGALECIAKKRECARACSLLTPSSAGAPAAPPSQTRPPTRTRYEWL